MKTKCFIILICAFSAFCLDSCAGRNSSQCLQFSEETTYLGSIPISDSLDLYHTFKESYSLQDLVDFFWVDPSAFWNSQVPQYESTSHKTVNEIEDHYPIGVIRKNGYIVYHVKEGGLFYVFLSDLDIYDRFSPECHSGADRIVASYCYYIEKATQYARFFHMRIGDTVEELKKKDPFLYVDHISARRVGHTFISKKYVLEFEFIKSGVTEDEWTVANKRIIDRIASPSFLSLILEKDIPKRCMCRNVLGDVVEIKYLPRSRYVLEISVVQ